MLKDNCRYDVEIHFKSLAVEKHNDVGVKDNFANAVTVVFDNGSVIIYPMDNIIKIELHPTR